MADPSPAARSVDSGPACNNACRGCPRGSAGTGAPAPTAPSLHLPDGDDPVTLHGGEPTLHPDFLGILSRGRDAGRALSVSTNGRAFAVPGRAAQARRAGLGRAEITLWGAREASHDFLTATPASFRQAVSGATHLRVAGVTLTVRLVITRSALGELAAMTTLALGLGAQAVRFSLVRMEPRPAGFALPPRPAVVDDAADPKGTLRVDFATPAGDRAGYDEHREWLVPRLSLVAEPLALASAAVTRVGRAALVDGVPLCLAPHGAVATRAAPGCFAPSTTGATEGYAAPCDGCAGRARCPGTPLGYLARFGPGELAPLPR